MTVSSAVFVGRYEAFHAGTGHQVEVRGVGEEITIDATRGTTYLVRALA